LHTLGLLIAQREAISSQAEFDGIAQGRAADDFDLCSVTEAHFEQTAAQVRVAADGDDPAAATDAQAVQATGFDRAGMRTSGEVARFAEFGVHRPNPYFIGLNLPMILHQ
jgi:hypothetical protein